MGFNLFSNLYKSWKFTLPLLSLCSCVSFQLIPPNDRISQIRSLEVVAIEPPPLTVSGELYRSGNLSFLSGTYGPGSGALGIINGIIVLIKTPKELHYVKTKSENYQSILSGDNVWVPTVILANKAGELLKDKSITDIKLRSGIKEVPGIKNRSSTILMENWYSPLRSWYNAGTSRIENNNEITADTILEVGIINYELMGNELLLQVLIKLVDGKTGKVIGKSRNYDIINVGNETLAFTNNAIIFKTKFLELGYLLLEKNLKNLNIIP